MTNWTEVSQLIKKIMHQNKLIICNKIINEISPKIQAIQMML